MKEWPSFQRPADEIPNKETPPNVAEVNDAEILPVLNVLMERVAKIVPSLPPEQAKDLNSTLEDLGVKRNEYE
jgi:hypothetical protein